MSEVRKVATPEGREDGDEGDAEHVGGEVEDGGPVEVEGHGKDHDGFGDEADEDEFGCPEGRADEGGWEGGGWWGAERRRRRLRINLQRRSMTRNWVRCGGRVVSFQR